VSAASGLETAVVTWLDENVDFWRAYPDRIPAGLRLEMHPGAYHEVLKDPKTLTWPVYGSELKAVAGIPVKRNAELEPFTWRLVVVTEDVKMADRIER
jgi:hypothetical protein